MDLHELALTAARALAIYAIILVLIRVLGKRTIGNFTAFDLLVALMLGEVVDEIIYGDVSFTQGVTAMIVIAAAKYVTAWLSLLSPGLSTVLEGRPTELVKNGEIVRQNLRSEMLNEMDVFGALRLQGISDMREVKKATMEIDGEISVIKEDWAEPLTKADIGKMKEHPADPPPDHQRTDTPRALGQAR